MAEYTIKPRQPSTWDAFAQLVERHNGVWGGCWCLSDHLTYSEKGQSPEGIVRIGGNHFHGNISSSTRRTLTVALLTPLGLRLERPARLDRASNNAVSEWMRSHLALATVSIEHRSLLAALEHDVLQCLDPPLNLMRMGPTPIRLRLRQLRKASRNHSTGSLSVVIRHLALFAIGAILSGCAAFPSETERQAAEIFRACMAVNGVVVTEVDVDVLGDSFGLSWTTEAGNPAPWTQKRCGDRVYQSLVNAGAIPSEADGDA